jgi:hypothetical protein
MKKHGFTLEAMDLLARLRAEAQPSREKELLAIAINAFLFITSTGQRYVFEDFLEHLDSGAPPSVVAAFDTREEAEAWLNSHPEPPDSTHVLIADDYYVVMYVRELNHRRLISHPVMEFHLGGLARDGLPEAVASFSTREQAESWLQSQAELPAQSVIRIAGEDYLAVDHRNVHRRSLYPFSIAEQVPEEPGDEEEGPQQQG